MKIISVILNTKLVNYSLLKNYKMPRFSDAMHQYINVHKKYGFPLDIDSPLKFSHSNETARLINDSLTYLRNFYDNPPLNKVKTCVEVIDNKDLNAFATKLNTGQRQTFLVAINSGLIDEYSAHFLNSNFIDEITKGFKQLNQLPINYLKEAAFTFAFQFIAFHELGHIYRGHLNYLNEHLSVNSISEAILSASSSNVTNSDDRLHIFECDADAFAGALLSAELISRWKRGLDNKMTKGKSSDLLEELVILFGAVIYYVFCIFDQKETEHDGKYPVPSIRTSIALSHMCAALHKSITNKKLIPSDKKLFSLTKLSFALAEGYVKHSPMYQSTKNLKDEVERWSKKYSYSYSSTGKDMAPYAPVPSF
jgi:hypothetical protein